MGFLKASEFDSFSRLDLDTRGEGLCRYLEEQESLGSVGEDWGGMHTSLKIDIPHIHLL